jgi:hypothetical protein
MEGWDLQAVVRGCMDEFIEAPTMADPESFFAPLSAVEDDLLGFPEISDTRAVLDELEILYKPFYPVSSQTILASSSSSSVSVPKELKQPEQQQQSKKQQPATYRRLRLVIWCKILLIVYRFNIYLRSSDLMIYGAENLFMKLNSTEVNSFFFFPHELQQKESAQEGGAICGRGGKWLRFVGMA